MSEPKPIPEGTEPAPGFIIQVFNCLWLTKDLELTSEWSRRGIWATEEEANKAFKEATKGLNDPN